LPDAYQRIPQATSTEARSAGFAWPQPTAAATAACPVHFATSVKQSFGSSSFTLKAVAVGAPPVNPFIHLLPQVLSMSDVKILQDTVASHNP
jgi:hypothetical protein